MFGNKRREREEQEALTAAFKAWFAAVEQARPAGLSRLTDELLAQVGSPYPKPPARGTFNDDVLFYTGQALGREWAARLARKAVLESDQDADSRHRFWESVSNWF